MGIPLAIEVTRALGLDDYLILQKTPKLHLRDAITEPVKSITTGAQQHLALRRRAGRGRQGQESGARRRRHLHRCIDAGGAEPAQGSGPSLSPSAPWSPRRPPGAAARRHGRARACAGRHPRVPPRRRPAPRRGLGRRRRARWPGDLPGGRGGGGSRAAGRPTTSLGGKRARELAEPVRSSGDPGRREGHRCPRVDSSGGRGSAPRRAIGRFPNT